MGVVLMRKVGLLEVEEGIRYPEILIVFRHLMGHYLFLTQLPQFHHDFWTAPLCNKAEINYMTEYTQAK